MSETPCAYFNICGNSLTFKKLPCSTCKTCDCGRCDACCGAVLDAVSLLSTAGVPEAAQVIERALTTVAALPATVLTAIRLQDALQPLADPHLKLATLRVSDAAERSGGYISPRNEKRLRKKLARKGRQ